MSSLGHPKACAMCVAPAENQGDTVKWSWAPVLGAVGDSATPSRLS